MTIKSMKVHFARKYAQNQENVNLITSDHLKPLPALKELDNLWISGDFGSEWVKKNFENILLVYASLVSNGQYLVISGKDVNTEYTINYENLVVFLKQVCNIEYRMHRDIFRRDLENNNNKFIDKRFNHELGYSSPVTF